MDNGTATDLSFRPLVLSWRLSSPTEGQHPQQTPSWAPPQSPLLPCPPTSSRCPPGRTFTPPVAAWQSVRRSLTWWPAWEGSCSCSPPRWRWPLSPAGSWPPPVSRSTQRREEEWSTWDQPTWPSPSQPSIITSGSTSGWRPLRGWVWWGPPPRCRPWPRHWDWQTLPGLLSVRSGGLTHNNITQLAATLKYSPDRKLEAEAGLASALRPLLTLHCRNMIAQCLPSQVTNTVWLSPGNTLQIHFWCQVSNTSLESIEIYFEMLSNLVQCRVTS